MQPVDAWNRALPWLVIGMLWLIVADYRGVIHDAVLYSFQAMAHLSPELYSGDVYLRFGSQDRFTAFTPVYAALISWSNVETAAGLAALIETSALLFAAWLLARRLTSASLAVAGVALLLALPSDYGPRSVFHFLEFFVTPRVFAEAAGLGAIVAIL